MVGILSKINFTLKNLILLVSNIYHIFHLMLESSALEGWIPPESVIRGSIYFQGKYRISYTGPYIENIYILADIVKDKGRILIIMY